MGEGARILVVDDDESVLRSFELMLEGAGYCVQLARSGEEALEQLRDGYDLVLADLKMPGLDGIGLLREAKETSPDTGVVIVTGHASLDTAIEAVREGASDYLLKMATTPMIMVAIERALEKQRLTLELRRRNQALAALHGVAAAVSATLELPELLERALDETLSTLDALSEIDDVQLSEAIREDLLDHVAAAHRPAVVLYARLLDLCAGIRTRPSPRSWFTARRRSG